MNRPAPITAPARAPARSGLSAIVLVVALGTMGAGATYVAGELLAHWIEGTPLTWHS